jgi:cob(I)alamin adenosyltransferase
VIIFSVPVFAQTASTGQKADSVKTHITKKSREKKDHARVEAQKAGNSASASASNASAAVSDSTAHRKRNGTHGKRH